MYTGSASFYSQVVPSREPHTGAQFSFFWLRTERNKTPGLRLHGSGLIWGFCFGAESFKVVSVNIALRTQYDSQGYGFDRASGPYPTLVPRRTRPAQNLSSGPPVCIRNRIVPLADMIVAKFVLGLGWQSEE
ncbi:hypothetical protein BY996DRAFT_6421000 [Phakopsora pachyrhizi]|nr:hypothetical protein BY996DRAFT_6421000 [Phakopsora pachyrhizi]